ncbi:MAG: hypothetical protein OEM52_12550 [bacterium]|nr:hypothetical protein [bacterium]
MKRFLQLCGLAVLLISFSSAAVAQPLPSRRTGAPPAGSGAFFKSLLVPGWGQWKQGRKSTAVTFFTSEIALIATSIGIGEYADWLEADYRSIAAVYGGLPDGRSRGHNFYVDMGNWNTTAEFNEARQRERAFERQYLDPADQWNWSDSDQRIRFKNIRIKADRMSDAVKFAVGAIVINHFISAIEASRYDRIQAKALKVPKVGVSVLPNSDTPAMKLSYNW